MWRLVCLGKLDIGMINQLSIDDVQLANEALEAWNKAERRAHERIEREAAAKMKGRGR